MKTPLCLLFTAVTAFGVSSAQAKIERVVEKTFTVQPGGLLTVTTEGGNIQLESHEGSEIKVTAKEKFRADSEADADDIAKKLTLNIDQQGNDVTAEAKYDGERSWGFHWNSWPPVQVDFVVSLPSHYNGNLKTSGGNISVDKLTGELRAHTSGGNLNFGQIDGTVDGHTSGGNVSLKEGSGRVELVTSGGAIHVGHTLGETTLKTSGGDIRIDRAESAIQADTSGGNIEATFAQIPREACVLKTSGGNVRVHVPSDAAFNLDASTSGGSVTTSGLALHVEHGGEGKSHLAGTVSAGGPMLKLHTSGGNVKIAAN